MDMRQIIGKNVRIARICRELTQEALANICGFSQQYLSELENGKRNPTAITIYEISQALRVGVHLLMIDHQDDEWLKS